MSQNRENIIAHTQSGVLRILEDREHFSHEVCVAAAVIMADGLEKTMTASEVKQFSEMAANIAELAYSSDEARFTLYDYLDACLHSPDRQWQDIAAEIAKAAASDDPAVQETEFENLVYLAERKRETYSI